MYSSQGRPIGDEAIFEVTPALADKLWQEALVAGHDVPSWVDHEDEAEVRIGKLLLAADNLRGMLPSEIIEAGRHFREKGNDYGAWLVKGLEPPEVVTQITLDSCSFPAHLSVARAAGIMATALAMTAGPPITFTTRPAPGSGAGGPASMFLTSVGPVEGLENEPLSSGQAIGWHCEVGACDWRPLSLALFCIKGQPKAQTGVLPPHKIIDRLDQETRGELERDAFSILDGLVPGVEDRPRPVISAMEGGRLTVVWHRRQLLPKPFDDTDTKAQDALDRLATVLSEPPQPTVHTLEAGQFMGIDNYGLHCRNAFDPKLPRWLLRLFVGGNRHVKQAPFIDPTKPYKE